MEFNPRSIVIYSVGLLGGSIGAGLKASGYNGKIIGISSEASIRIALSLGIIDEGKGYDDFEVIATNVDCIFLCSPIMTIIEAIKKLGKMRLPDGLVITDVGSTKSEIVSCARNVLPLNVEFIGGHPMAGSEKSGAGASDPFLFQNAMYLLAPVDNATGSRSGSFASFIEHFLGCRTVIIDPVEHDAIVAAVSHVPHILSVALVNLARQAEDARPGTLKMAAGGFRDMTRIASAPYSMWHDILATNKKAIAPLIDSYIAILKEMKSSLAADKLEASFSAAAETRSEIPQSNKGFIRPQFDILVVAKDQPGIIAEMSGALARVNINIKDIEVLKVREGEAGTIRMAFESRETADNAISVLTSLGLTARERD
jgi:prephenate dehydrogenase